MGWWSNAWDKVSGAVVDAGSAVVNTVADVAVHATAEVLNAGTSVINAGSNLVGQGDVVDNFDFVDERIEARNEFVEDAVVATGAALVATKDFAVNTAIGIKDTAVAAKDWTVNAAIATKDWTVETGLPALKTGAEWTSGALLGEDINRAIGWDGAAEKGKIADDALRGFAEFVKENPGRAWDLAKQGFTNGVVSTVGMVGDLGRMVVIGAGDVGRNIVSGAYDIGRNVVSGTYDLANTARKHTWNAVYSLGQEDGEPPAYQNIETFETTRKWNEANGDGGFFSTTKHWNGDSAFFRWTGATNEGCGGAFGWSEWMNKKTQWFADRIEPQFLADTRKFVQDENGDMVDNPAYMKKYELAEGEERPDYVNIVDNPNANYERVLLYGGQAVFEVPAFVGTAVFTGGASTSVYLARFGGKTVQTAAMLKRADMVADTIRLTDKARKLANPRTGLGRFLPRIAPNARASSLTSKADEIAKGVKYASTGDRIVDATRTGLRRMLMRKGDDIGRALKQSDLMEYLGKFADKLRNASTKLDDMLESGTAAQREFIERYRALRLAQKANPTDKLAKSRLDDLVKSATREQKTVLNQARKVENAEDALERATASVNRLTKSDGNHLAHITDEVARTASQTTEHMTGLRQFTTNFNYGATRGFRLADPFRSPIIDGTMVAGTWTFGVYIDQKVAADLKASGAKVGELEAQRVIEEGTEDMKKAGEDTSWAEEFFNKPPAPETETDTVPENNGTQGGSLKDDFQENEPVQNGDDPLPGDGQNRDQQQSGVFNNRANGLFIPGDNQPLFSVAVSREAASQFTKAIRQA